MPASLPNSHCTPLDYPERILPKCLQVSLLLLMSLNVLSSSIYRPSFKRLLIVLFDFHCHWCSTCLFRLVNCLTHGGLFQLLPFSRKARQVILPITDLFLLLVLRVSYLRLALKLVCLIICWEMLLVVANLGITVTLLLWRIWYLYAILIIVWIANHGLIWRVLHRVMFTSDDLQLTRC